MIQNTVCEIFYIFHPCSVHSSCCIPPSAQGQVGEIGVKGAKGDDGDIGSTGDTVLPLAGQDWSM